MAGSASDCCNSIKAFISALEASSLRWRSMRECFWIPCSTSDSRSRMSRLRSAKSISSSRVMPVGKGPFCRPPWAFSASRATLSDRSNSAAACSCSSASRAASSAISLTADWLCCWRCCWSASKASCNSCWARAEEARWSLPWPPRSISRAARSSWRMVRSSCWRMPDWPLDDPCAWELCPPCDLLCWPPWLCWRRWSCSSSRFRSSASRRSISCCQRCSKLARERSWACSAKRS